MIKGFFVSLCFYDFFCKNISFEIFRHTGLVKNMDLGFLFPQNGQERVLLQAEDENDNSSE